MNKIVIAIAMVAILITSVNADHNKTYVPIECVKNIPGWDKSIYMLEKQIEILQNNNKRSHPQKTWKMITVLESNILTKQELLYDTKILIKDCHEADHKNFNKEQKVLEQQTIAGESFLDTAARKTTEALHMEQKTWDRIYKISKTTIDIIL